MYMRQQTKKKNICSGDLIYWVSLIALAVTCLATVIALQKSRKQAHHLSWRLEEAGSSRVHERNLLHSRLKNLEEEVVKMTRERDNIADSQKKLEGQLKQAQTDKRTAQEESKKLREGSKQSGDYEQLQMQLRETEARLQKSEKTVKEITVKAGECQREFASLNANYETVKQDVNNIAQELSVSGRKQEVKPQQKVKAVNAGELDPRGGMEAAKVLNDELPGAETVENKLQVKPEAVDTDFMRAHPLKIDETVDKYETSSLETSEGLEKANLGVQTKSASIT